MGAPLETMFRATPRDQQSTLWGPRYEQISDAAALTLVSVGGPADNVPFPQMPFDRIEWIKRVSVICIPNAGGTVVSIAVFMVSEGESIELASDYSPAPLNQRKVLQFNADLLMRGAEHSLQAVGAFLAGAGNNTTRLTWHSDVTIRGNIALF